MDENEKRTREIETGSTAGSSGVGVGRSGTQGASMDGRKVEGVQSVHRQRERRAAASDSEQAALCAMHVRCVGAAQRQRRNGRTIATSETSGRARGQSEMKRSRERDEKAETESKLFSVVWQLSPQSAVPRPPPRSRSHDMHAALGTRHDDAPLKPSKALHSVPWYRHRRNTRTVPAGHLTPAAPPVPPTGHARFDGVHVKKRRGMWHAKPQRAISYGHMRSTRHSHVPDRRNGGATQLVGGLAARAYRLVGTSWMPIGRPWPDENTM